MNAQQLLEEDKAGSQCPRRAGCEAFEQGGCEVLDAMGGNDGSGSDGPGGIDDEVRKLLECRSFLWDVLLEGRWCGCAREQLRQLGAEYGTERLLEAFEDQ